jgi:hypothetical protein
MRTTKAVRLLAAAAAALVLGGCAELFAPGDGAHVPNLPPAAVQLTPAQQLVLEEDAVRLALRHLAATNTPALQEVEPPAALVGSLFNALAAVHGLTHPARDTVVNVYRIRTFPNPPVWEIMVRVEPGAPWTAAWRGKQALTGYAPVDELVNRWDLTIREYYYWSIGEVAVLRAGRPLNMQALAARFAALNGVVWAEPNGFGGDGNDIRARVQDGGWRLDYSVGYGDCPAGCTSRHTWSFHVGSGGAVSYLGSAGSGPPPATGQQPAP